MSLNIQPSRVSKLVMFNCGCICEYTITGYNSGHPYAWHVTPCFAHADHREEVGKAAEAVWNQALEDGGC